MVVSRGHVQRGEITREQLDKALDVLAMTRPPRLRIPRPEFPSSSQKSASLARLDCTACIPLPGTGHLVAGRYRLLSQLGRGAMGIVWHGRDELLDRDVAVKQIVLPPMASAADAQASYQRTLREARTAARLSHHGVVTVFDVVEEAGLPWIVMELVRAGRSTRSSPRTGRCRRPGGPARPQPAGRTTDRARGRVCTAT